MTPLAASTPRVSSAVLPNLLPTGFVGVLPARGERIRRCFVILSEHPKAAIHEHLKSGHTFRRNVQDIDSSGRVSSLSQHGECLEGREETANHSVGTTGMVSAQDPRGHASASRDHQRLPERRGRGNMAAGKMEARKKGKTGHRGDHRLGCSKTGHSGVCRSAQPQPQPRKPF